MPVDFSAVELGRDVIAGFDEAADSYVALSGGWEVYRAPEYYCTVKIAEKLAESDSRYVTLEQNIADALKWTRHSATDGRTANLPQQGRFDIAVWGPGSEGILGIVEVKEVQFATYANVKGDVERVCTALNQTETLQCGIVAWYASVWDGEAKSGQPKSGADRLATRTERIAARAADHAACKSLRCEWLSGTHREFADDYQGGVGRADVLVFQRP